MNWKEQFDKRFYKDDREFVRCKAHKAHITEFELRDFISTEITKKLMIDVLSRIHDPKLRESLKQQLRDKWL